MTFQGIPYATVMQVLGATAAAVTALYLLKLRRRRVTVPFSPLWARLVAETESRSLLRRLRRLLSWLLALAFAAAVAVAAGDPRADPAGEDRRTWVVILDASASMGALDGSPTRFDDARRQARRVVDSLREGDTLMLLRVDADVTPLTPFSADRRELVAALDAARAGQSAADLHRGLRFAQAALAGRPGPWIVVITDLAGEAPGPEAPAPAGDAGAVQGGPPVSYVAVGKDADNVGILAFNARPYRANRRQFEVFLRVRNAGATPARCRVSISADGVLSEVLPLDVGAGATVDHLFPDLVVTGRRLEAALEVLDGPRDLLPADDRAYALLPDVAPLRVGLVSRGNLFLEAALLLDENLEVVQVDPDGWPGGGPRPDAWVFDRFAPDAPPPEPALYVAPPADRSPWRVTGVAAPDDLVRKLPGHPLARWVGVPDLGAEAAMAVATGDDDVVVFRAGAVPLVVATAPAGGGPRRALWTFDPLASDLPLKSAFPLMLMHTFEWFARGDDEVRSSWRVGDAWRVPARVDGPTAEVVEPDGAVRVAPALGGDVRFRGRHAGFHEVRPIAGGKGDVVVVAASMANPAESAIGPSAARVQAGLAAAPPPLRPAATGGRPPWILLAALAAAWLAVEWLSFQRRWTV